MIADESFSKKYDDECLVPNAIVPDEEAGEELITIADEIPFRKTRNSD